MKKKIIAKIKLRRERQNQAWLDLQEQVGEMNIEESIEVLLNIKELEAQLRVLELLLI